MSAVYKVRVYRVQELALEVVAENAELAKDAAVCDLDGFPAEMWDTVSVDTDATEVGFRDLPGLATQ